MCSKFLDEARPSVPVPVGHKAGNSGVSEQKVSFIRNQFLLDGCCVCLQGRVSCGHATHIAGHCVTNTTLNKSASPAHRWVSYKDRYIKMRYLSVFIYIPVDEFSLTKHGNALCQEVHTHNSTPAAAAGTTSTSTISEMAAVATNATISTVVAAALTPTPTNRVQ